MHLELKYPANWEVRSHGKQIGIFEPLENSSDNFEDNMVIWTEEMPMAISDSIYSRAATAELLIKDSALKIDRQPPKKIGTTTYYPFAFSYLRGDSSWFHISGYTVVSGTRGYNFSCISTREAAARHQAQFEMILSHVKLLP